MATPVTVVIHYRAAPGRADTAVRELADLIRIVVEREPDCRGITLHQDTADPERILLLEDWTSQDAYTGPHMRTPHLTDFIARAPGFLAGPPEISFWGESARAVPH